MLVPGNQMMMRASGVPPVSCAYQLNDDGTVATLFGLGFAPATGPGYQDITYVLTGSATNNTTLTAPASPFSAPALTTFTGRKAIGFTTPQLGTTVNDQVYPTLICYDAGLGNIYRFRIEGTSGNVLCESGPTSSLTTDVSLTGVDVENVTYGIVADADTGVVHFYVDGILVGSASNLLDKPTGFVSYNFYDGPSASVGQTVQATIVSDAATLGSYGFTPGTTTLCGTTIASSTPGYPLADDGTVAGLFGVGWIPTTAPIYNQATYTLQVPSSPSQNYALPNISTFFSSQSLAMSGKTIACELLISTIPPGAFDGVSMQAVFWSTPGTPTGTASVGVLDATGSNPVYIASGPTVLPRTVSSDIRIGIIVDEPSGTLYFVTGEGQVAQDAIPGGSNYVSFAWVVNDDGLGSAGQTINAQLVPNAGDMSLLYAPGTVDYQDLPCPVNPAWSPFPAPTVTSIETDTLGTSITVTFDIPVNNSPQLGWSFTKNASAYTPTTFSQPTSTTYLYGGFATYIDTGDTLLCSYVNPPGTVESDPDAILLANFTDAAVTNNVPANPTCNYPFTVLDTNIVGSNFDETMTYTTESGTVTRTATPALFPNSPFMFNVTSGITAIEFSLDQLPTPAGGLVGFEERVTFTKANNSAIGYVGVQSNAANFAVTLSMTGYGSSSYNLGTTRPYRLGIAFDANTADMYVYIDNVQVLTKQYDNTDDAALAMTFIGTSVSGADIGLTLEYTCIPYGPDMQMSCYPEGAVDNCMNLVSSALAYPLDDTGNTVTPLGYTVETSVVSPKYQQLSYTTTQAATGDFAISMPDLDSDFGLYPTLGLGRYGVGFKVTSMPAVGAGEVMMVNLYASYFTIGSTSKTYVFAAMRNDTDDLYSTFPVTSSTPLTIGTIEYLNTVPSVENKNFGILIDTQAQRLQYYFDGQYLGTSVLDSSSSSANWYFALGVADSSGGTYGPNPSGVTVDYELITNAADLVGFGFPPGTLAIGGDKINFIPEQTYATWDPAQIGGNITLSNGNKTVTEVGGSLHSARATVGVSTGKYYWEINVGSGGDVFTGVGTSSATLNNYLGIDVNGHGYYSVTGNYFTNGAGGAYGATYTTGDVIGIALDMDAGEIEMFKNNVSQGVMATGLTGTMYPMVSASNSAITANFGATSFTYYPPLYYQAGIFA
jgi:hypothetical protein